MQTLFEAAKQAGPLADPFTVCWQLWPRKDKKEYSRECYKRACRRAYPEVIESAIRSFLKKNAATDKQFIPHLSTWLNQRRWVDEEQPVELASNAEKLRLEGIAWIIKRGLQSDKVSAVQARECLKAGLITEKEAKDYGA